MLSMFLMSFLDSVLMTGPGLGLGSCGLVLSEVWEGEAQLGGETGGEEAAPLLLLGVRLLKAEGPEGEMEAGWAAGDTREYGENLCCLSLSARTELATPVYPPRSEEF